MMEDPDKIIPPVPDPGVEDDTVSVDDFLGGAIKLIQPKDGYRVSMDTVMLAAAVPAKPGERVIEGGVGSAGAALCLARRVGGVLVDGIDIQSDMLAAAKRNIAFNALEDRVRVHAGSVADLPPVVEPYDHAMINPPYLADGKAIRPPSPNKGLAHMDESVGLKDWIRFCLHHVRHKGTITVIYRADRLDELMARLHRRVGDISVLPLWPRMGQPAKRVIVQGRKGTHGVSRMLPGIALHGEVERYTAEARRVLWDGAPLDIKAFAQGGQNR